MGVQIIEIANPFEPFKDTAHYDIDAGVSVRGWLESQYPGFVEFERPTLCLLNGHALMRSDWDQSLKDGDLVSFVVMPGGVETVFIIVAVLVIASIAINMIPTPQTPGQIPEADPVYSLTGQRNQIRLLQPIEAAYGRVRVWPSYATRAHNNYRNNDQYQYQLFSVSQGQFQFEKLMIEDTALDQYQDIESEVVQPGQAMTLFPDNVVTSSEVAGVELYGPNESDYEGWRSFIANPAGTQTNRLEVDLVLSAGLYYANDDGGLDNRTVSAEWQYREVDDGGNSIGDWQAFAVFSKTLKTVTPQRYTLRKWVTKGRYEVRARRTNNASNNHRVGDTLEWASLRAILPSTRRYGDVTLLAISARATNNLNDQSSNRINGIGTRLLPVWDKTTRTWSDPVPTRSIVWAFCDVFRSEYGGKASEDLLDMDHLHDLDVMFNGRSEYFDWVFDQKTNVWEAAKTIARVGRCVPIVNGSVITMVRDAVATLPRAMFTHENIIRGSFKRDIKLIDTSDYDSVEIEYTDPVTWKPETILCTMPDRSGHSPKNIKLPGCTERTHAYREGMYIAARDRYINESIVFRTGMEGHIPSFGDLIAISHDLPRWGKGGFVEEINGRVVELSEPVEFDEGKHYLVFRKSDGSATGSYQVELGAHARQVVLVDDLEEPLFFSSAAEPPMFMFGKSEKWGKLCKVVGLAPSDDGNVEVTAEGYEAVVHSFDQHLPPAIVGRATPPAIPALPVVSGIRVSQLPDSLSHVLVSWQPALGAKSYLLQQSTDGENWSQVERLSGTHYTLPVIKGYLHIRVAAINSGAGPWDSWEGEVGVPAGIPNNVIGLQLQTAFTGTFCKVQWQSVINASIYRIRVYKGSETTPLRTVEVSSLSYTYSIENAREDGAPSRHLRFEVVGVNSLGESDTAAVLSASNPIPAFVTGINSEVLTDTTSATTHTVGWSASPDVDIDKYQVWASATTGFIPSAYNLVYEGAASQGQVTVNKVDGVAPTHYWRVAAVDIWGDEVNVSAEQVV